MKRGEEVKRNKNRVGERKEMADRCRLVVEAGVTATEHRVSSDSYEDTLNIRILAQLCGYIKNQ